MSKTKAITDFSNYTGPDLSPAATNIYAQMGTNDVTFINPPVSMGALQIAIADYDTKLAAKASRATDDIIAFEVSRHTLENDLNLLGVYVNLVAKGDATIVAQSGFPSYDTARTADNTPPPAPTDLQLRQGDLSGSLVARYHPARQPSMNELQKNTGDPNDEAGWSYAGMFSGGKANLAGFTPGTVVWVRVRTAGTRGTMGAWSDPARLMVV